MKMHNIRRRLSIAAATLPVIVVRLLRGFYNAMSLPRRGRKGGKGRGRGTSMASRPPWSRNKERKGIMRNDGGAVWMLALRTVRLKRLP